MPDEPTPHRGDGQPLADVIDAILERLRQKEATACQSPMSWHDPRPTFSSAIICHTSRSAYNSLT